MSSTRSLKGFLPATAFAMAKKAEVQAKAAPATRQDLPTSPQNSKTSVPRSTATTHLATLSPQFLFLEFSPTLSGASSELLEKMIDAMSLKRDQTRIASLHDFTAQTLADTRFSFGSKVVIALGEETARAILKSDEALTKLRGKVHFLKTGERVIATFHPAYLLQNPQAKKDAWEDLKLALREMSAP